MHLLLADLPDMTHLLLSVMCLPLPFLWWNSFAAFSHSMQLICHFLSFIATHLPLSLFQQCYLFAAFSPSTTWLICHSYFNNVTGLPFSLLKFGSFATYSCLMQLICCFLSFPKWILCHFLSFDMTHLPWLIYHDSFTTSFDVTPFTTSSCLTICILCHFLFFDRATSLV